MTTSSRPRSSFALMVRTDLLNSSLNEVIACLMSLTVKYRLPLEKVADLLAGAKFAPCGDVTRHTRIKHWVSLPGLTGRDLLVKVMRTPTVDHVPVTVMNSSS